MTPDAFGGLWRRRSLAIGGGAPTEPAEVHWIQWGDRFLDLRSPNGGDQARPLCGPGVFGGHTAWDEPVLVWHHDLDSDPGGGADAGEVSWEGGFLVERGTATIDGAATPYVEVWERITPPSPTAGRAWTPWPGARAVEAAGHRIVAVVVPDGRWAGARSAEQPDGSWAVVGWAGTGELLDRVRPALLGAS